MDDLKQLYTLAIMHDSFQAGSRIIITTRDEHLLLEAMVDLIYKLPALNYEESLLLFSWYAFGKFHPDESYVEPSKEVLYYARGLPLVMKVLGCLSVRQERLRMEKCIERIKRISL